MFHFLELKDGEASLLREAKNEDHFWDICAQELGPDYVERHTYHGLIDVSFNGDYSVSPFGKIFLCGADDQGQAISLPEGLRRVM